MVGLYAYLKRYGSRLGGGNTGQYFLRQVGMDNFIVGRDVVLTVQLAGVDVADNPTCKRDLQKVQNLFNAWHDETGYSHKRLSRVAAMSAGENHI